MGHEYVHVNLNYSGYGGLEYVRSTEKIAYKWSITPSKFWNINSLNYNKMYTNYKNASDIFHDSPKFLYRRPW